MRLDTLLPVPSFLLRKQHRQECRCHTSLVIPSFNLPRGAWARDEGSVKNKTVRTAKLGTGPFLPCPLVMEFSVSVRTSPSQWSELGQGW
jgi:hypothetical protein